MDGKSDTTIKRYWESSNGLNTRLARYCLVMSGSGLSLSRVVKSLFANSPTSSTTDLSRHPSHRMTGTFGRTKRCSTKQIDDHSSQLISEHQYVAKLQNITVEEATTSHRTFHHSRVIQRQRNRHDAFSDSIKSHTKRLSGQLPTGRADFADFLSLHDIRYASDMRLFMNFRTHVWVELRSCLSITLPDGICLGLKL